MKKTTFSHIVVRIEFPTTIVSINPSVFSKTPAYLWLEIEKSVYHDQESKYLLIDIRHEWRSELELVLDPLSQRKREEEEDGPVTMINVGLLHHDVFVSRAFLHSNLNDSAKKISNLPTNESLGPSQKSEEHYSGLQK